MKKRSIEGGGGGDWGYCSTGPITRPERDHERAQSDSWCAICFLFFLLFRRCPGVLQGGEGLGLPAGSAGTEGAEPGLWLRDLACLAQEGPLAGTRGWPGGPRGAAGFSKSTSPDGHLMRASWICSIQSHHYQLASALAHSLWRLGWVEGRGVTALFFCFNIQTLLLQKTWT